MATEPTALMLIWTIYILPNLLIRCSNSILFSVVGADNDVVRSKRQSDDGEDDALNTDELCQDRPADEYFRATLEGDCRDVVR